MLGCAQQTNFEKSPHSKGVGEARPEEILLRISYRIVNGLRPGKSEGRAIRENPGYCRYPITHVAATASADQASAIISISTRKSRGKRAASTVVRAGAFAGK